MWTGLESRSPENDDAARLEEGPFTHSHAGILPRTSRSTNRGRSRSKVTLSRETFKMTDDLAKEMREQGFRNDDCTAVEEVCEARTCFGNLCGGALKNGKAGGTVGQMFKDQVKGMDVENRRADFPCSVLKRIQLSAGKAYMLGCDHYDKLMMTWDQWKEVIMDIQIPASTDRAVVQNRNKTYSNIETLGEKKSVKEVHKLHKFVKFLNTIMAPYNLTIEEPCKQKDYPAKNEPRKQLPRKLRLQGHITKNNSQENQDSKKHTTNNQEN